MQLAVRGRIWIVSVAMATSSYGSVSMPVAQQNALVQKYCAVCHTDAAKNGGLSLEHFDAGQAPPSLTAMLLSKLTGGVSLHTARGAGTDAVAATLVAEKVKSGAMNAAGIPKPDKATMDALIGAFTMNTTGATHWNVERQQNAPGVVTVSILREAPSAKAGTEAEAYRLVASCDTRTREGYMQLTWSPVPQSGSLAASVDGKKAVAYQVAGSETMGNGSGAVLHGVAAVMLSETRRDGSGTHLAFPAESLTITGLFPGETVTFPFTILPADARRELDACLARAPVW